MPPWTFGASLMRTARRTRRAPRAPEQVQHGLVACLSCLECQISTEAHQPTYLAGQSSSKHKGLKAPPAGRSEHGLVGLANLGTTCYLNSLLQTMFYTPGLREKLFDLSMFQAHRFASYPIAHLTPISLPLGHEELGLIDGVPVKGKYRSIPAELRVSNLSCEFQ